MNSGENKAVFLSYASQDADAARRICEALRMAGVEVWFDQSELRGGDAWDAMIRKRIKECALFVPVISGNTNARAEGYFRLEWKLAVDRSHLMADDAPFLFPVVIGDVTDAAARVPDKFREVQWTRLRLDETPAELAGRVARVLQGDVVGSSGAAFTRPAGNSPGSPPPATTKSKSGFEKWWWLIFPIMGMSIPIIGVLRRDFGRGPRPERNQPPAVTVPGVPAARSEARQLAERARAMSLDNYNSTGADYATAEGLLKRALELDQNDAEIWAISSLFNTSIRTRGFEHGPVRREKARRDAERAVALAPDSVNALFALGRSQRDADRVAAEATFRRILALDPDHAEAMAQVAWLCDLTDRLDEAAALYDRVLVLDPKSAPLTHYIRYLLYFHYGRFAEAEAAIKQSVALEPAANSVTGEAIVALTWRGDTEAAARALAAAPAEMQDVPRMIWVGALVHLARRDPAETLRTLQRIEAVYLQDNWFAGPKGMFAGLAHRQAGRNEAARVAWEAALAVVDERLKPTPDNGGLHLARGQLLAWLGRTDEARREARTLVELEAQTGGEPYWMDSPVMIHAALGDADAAAPMIEKLLAWDPNRNNGWPLTAALLRTDVRWDPLRANPRFQQLLARAEAAQHAATPARDWPTDPELKRAIQLVEGFESIPDDFALAEEIARRAVDRAPTDAEAVTVLARIQGMYLLRGFDRSDERLALAQRYSERAAQLAPEEPEALFALGNYLYNAVTDTPRAERVLRRAIGLDPANPRPARLLSMLLFNSGRRPEGLALAEENARRFPQDALSQYDLARQYRDEGRMAEFERQIDATIAITPIPNAIVWKARVQFGVHNDLAGMRAWLDRVPERVRGVERTVFSRFLHAAFSHQPEEGLEALRGFQQRWFVDFEYVGPTALLAAELLNQQGKRELARRQYEAALGETERQKALNPANPGVVASEFWTQLGLGRTGEAQAAYRLFLESLNRPYRQGTLNNWWFTIVPAALLIGERETAVILLRESIENVPASRAAYRLRFQLDPRMAPFRDDAEIRALLAEPAKD